MINIFLKNYETIAINLIVAICIMTSTIKSVAIYRNNSNNLFCDNVVASGATNRLWLFVSHSTIMNVASSRKFAMVNIVAFCGKIGANIVCGRVADTHLQIATSFK